MYAIYARQSIDKKDSLSIEGQIEQCRKYAGEEAAVFQDRGYSGKNIKRPAFTELIKAVEAGRIHKIFVYRLDRFSRSIADFSRLWEVLEQHRVEFQSVTEQFDTSSPMGRAMLHIVLVFAQLERETTAERVRDNYIHRFSLGAWGGGSAPFGFDITKVMSDGRKVTSLAENENAEIVDGIFNDYTAEKSLRSIAFALTKADIKSPRKSFWNSVTISRILRNPAYVKATEEIYWYFLSKGYKIDQDIEAFDGVHGCCTMKPKGKDKTNEKWLTVSNHLGFIDADVWLSAQEKLSNNKSVARAAAGKHTWLTGLLKCAKCGYALKIICPKCSDRKILACSGKSNFAICDSSVSVDLLELETYVEQQIVKMLKDAPPTEAIPNTRESSAEILMIEQKIERLVSVLAESSDISTPYIVAQIEKLHKEREEILSRPKTEYYHAPQLDFASSTFEEKKLIAARFIDKILIEGDEVNIIWKV